MDTRREHPHTPPSRRERDLADELAQTLRCFADAMRFHPCNSCETDLDICLDKARALGVETRR
jgi:hypothetical protein